MSTWFRRGFSGLDHFVHQPITDQPYRVSVLPGEEKIITIIDDEPFCHQEHKVRINGKPQWFTCSKRIGENCLACEQLGAPYFTALFTVLHTAVSDFDGVPIPRTYQNIYAACRTAAVILEEQHRLKGSLAGYKYRIRNLLDRAESPRECVKSLGRVPLEHYGSVKPFDYERFFAPRTQQGIEKLIRDSDERMVP